MVLVFLCHAGHHNANNGCDSSTAETPVYQELTSGVTAHTAQCRSSQNEAGMQGFHSSDQLDLGYPEQSYAIPPPQLFDSHSWLEPVVSFPQKVCFPKLYATKFRVARPGDLRWILCWQVQIVLSEKVSLSLLDAVAGNLWRLNFFEELRDPLVSFLGLGFGAGPKPWRALHRLPIFIFGALTNSRDGNGTPWLGALACHKLHTRQACCKPNSC